MYYSKNKDNESAALVSYTKKKKLLIELANQYKITPERSIKGKINSSGILSFSLESKLSNYAFLVFSTKLNLFDATNSLKFGFNLNLNS